jgi:pyochelin biosynthetic protein PchC
MDRKNHRRWIRPLNSGDHRAVHIVCFPHSGGSAGEFRSWRTLLPPDIALAAVQYPGRGDRFHEKPIADVRQMSAPIAAELLALATVPTVLFGHSMGALLAYEVALLLQDEGLAPAHLFVSGSPAPSRAGGGTTHLASDGVLWSTVCRLGGVEPAVEQDEELRELLLPTLRSDITASETYRPRPGRGLSCPVTCYHGLGDPLVRQAQLREWAAITTGPFVLRTRAGGHFHLRVDPPALVADLVGSAGSRSSGVGPGGERALEDVPVTPDGADAQTERHDPPA